MNIFFKMTAVILFFWSSSVSAEEIGCHGGSLFVCGVPIGMPDMTRIGDRALVHIPASVLGDSYAANPDLHFTVQCVGGDQRGASFRALDADKISCNAFPCQKSTVRLCNASISVPGGTPIGGVVNMTMPSPFTKDGFRVQCVGNGDASPVYQLMDHSAVSCKMAAASP